MFTIEMMLIISDDYMMVIISTPLGVHVLAITMSEELKLMILM